MASTPPLWTGREPGDDHGWLARPTVRPRPRPVEPPPEPPPPRRRRWPWVLLATVLVVLVAAAFVAGTRTSRSRPEADAALTVQGGPAARDAPEPHLRRRGPRGRLGPGRARQRRRVRHRLRHRRRRDDRHERPRRRERASVAQVRFDDKGAQLAAKVVGTDPSSDLAVLQRRPPARRGCTRSRSRTPTASRSATTRSRSATRSAWTARRPRASSPASGREIQAPNGFASTRSSRPTRRSTPATRAARCSTPAAASSA